jgi:hypothetical protein
MNHPSTRTPDPGAPLPSSVGTIPALRLRQEIQAVLRRGDGELSAKVDVVLPSRLLAPSVEAFPSLRISLSAAPSSGWSGQ